MSTSGQQMHATCRRPTDFVVRVWDDGAVVYDEADGSLQALNPIAGEAFQLLLTHPPLNVRALARLLMNAEPSEEEESMVDQLLTQFVAMGLVERVPE